MSASLSGCSCSSSVSCRSISCRLSIACPCRCTGPRHDRNLHVRLVALDPSLLTTWLYIHLLSRSSRHCSPNLIFDLSPTSSSIFIFEVFRRRLHSSSCPFGVPPSFSRHLVSSLLVLDSELFRHTFGQPFVLLVELHGTSMSSFVCALFILSRQAS